MTDEARAGEPRQSLRFYPIALTATEIRDAVAALGPTGTQAEARVKASALGMADAIEAAAAPVLDWSRVTEAVSNTMVNDYYGLPEDIAAEYARLSEKVP